MTTSTRDRQASLLQTIYTTRCAGGDGAGVEQMLPPDRTSFYAYGRQALAEALRRVGVGPGERVLLPGLICREVLASLSAVGAVPVFYAVDDTLTADAASLQRAGAGGVRAVVAVNYFGFPQPLDAFRACCRQWEAALLEDNAHGFLSAEGEAPLGRRGDLGIFSFRKTLTVPNGAALVDNRRAPSTSFEDGRYHGSPRYAQWRYRLKAGLKPVMGWGGLSGARMLLTALRGVRRLATGQAVPSSVPEAEIAMPSESFAPLTSRLLRRLDVTSERRRRRELYEWCARAFADVAGARPVFGRLAAGVAPQGFPVWLMTGRETPVVKSWGARGVPIVSWPDLPSEILAQAPVHYQTLHVVPFLW